MSPTEQNLEAIANLLKTVRTSQEVKLRYGSMKRTEMKEQIAKKQKPSGYRAEWLKDRRNELIKQLGKMAKDFNELYPHDCCSLQDLKDLVYSVSAYIDVVQDS